MSDLDTALREADRVRKKQKTCASASSDILDQLLKELTAARASLAEHGPAGAASVLKQLQNHLETRSLDKQLSDRTKELHSAVAKLGKAIDKAFVPDVCKATREIQFSSHQLNQVIAEHFLRVGRFDIAHTFIREANIPNGETMRASFQGMHDILQQVMAHNLTPALQWVAKHREALEHSNREFASQGFEFHLHQLQFLHCLSTQGALAAVAYARANFGRFQATHMPGIQKVMGCLCYTKRPLPAVYQELMAPEQWAATACEFARQCCSLLGQAYESPLLVTIAAGSLALPTLLKLASVMAGQAQDLSSLEQLPVDLELGREFVFHSIFACPVSRDQSSPSNPPMMLPCGHVLCATSIDCIAKSPQRPFKCPYCPHEATKAMCKQLYFPDEL